MRWWKHACAGAAILAAAVLLGHRLVSDRRGRLFVAVGERTARMRAAFVLSRGGKSFVLVATTEKADCAWARSKSWLRGRSDDVRLELVVSPVLDPHGTPRWRIKEGSVSTDGVLFGRVTPSRVEVRGTDPRCPSRILVGNPDLAPGEDGLVPQKTYGVTGEVTPECCDGDVPLIGPGPMTARVGDMSYPLTHAGARRGRDGVTRIVVTVQAHPCETDGLQDDLALELTMNPDGGSARGAVWGRVVYGVSGGTGQDPPLTIARRDGMLRVRGVVDYRQLNVGHLPPEDRVYRVDVEGEVPVTDCMQE